MVSVIRDDVDLERPLTLYRYLAILEVCEAVQIPCPLPVFDLSSKIFPPKKEE